MEASSNDVQSPSSATEFQARQNALQRRVNESARVLVERGIRPTVARVRAALGGGSPNDLTPALKHWKEVVLPTLPEGAMGGGSMAPGLPLQISDLMRELWQRAMSAALVEVRGGVTAQALAARTAEAQSLHQRIAGLREQLQRESLAYGELRAQAARHEAIAREAVARAHEADFRERELLREMGFLRQKLAMLEAVAGQKRKGKRSGPAAVTRGGAAGGKAKSSSARRDRRVSVGPKGRTAKGAAPKVRRRRGGAVRVRGGKARRR